MISINFGIFAEDAANEIFIKNAVRQLVEHCEYGDKIKLIHNIEYTSRVEAKSGGFVSKYFINYILSGIKENALDLCLVGRDSDDNEHHVLYKKMESDLVESELTDKALLYIPVQAVEYWLWYIKVKKENPGVENTLVIDRVKSRQELKQDVYSSTRARISNKKSNPIVEALSKDIDFDWLKLHSNSFEHFYNLFENYLKMITAERERRGINYV